MAQDELDDVLEGEIHLDVVGFCISDWMPKCVDLGEAIQTRGQKREERVKWGRGGGTYYDDDAVSRFVCLFLIG